MSQNNSVPTVTIHAPDSIATESGDPATFEVDRLGPTNATLNIYYNVGGTASNGVDYKMISHFVAIPAGARSASILIQPLQDTNVAGTLTVILQLAPSQLLSPQIPMNPVNYIIGSPSNAVAYIFDDDNGSNPPPAVAIISPPPGTVFSAPANIQLIAKTFDVGGSVSNVEFFAGSQDLGAANMVVLDPPGINGIVGPVYFLSWAAVPPGNYSITAVAAGNAGASTTSDSIEITVLPPPPTVKITSPANGAIFTTPVDIPITAEASSSNADVVRVDFLADDHFIGAKAGINLTQYSMVWSNAPPGFYSLQAVAIDSFGGQGFSGSVDIAVVGTNLPPPHPSIVTIYARDPIAVVGTNCLSCYSNTMANLNFRAVTNTATFVVRRSGETNSALTVYYSISGTASNGEDYATLPGFVTIPAGRRSALVEIDPLAESGVECPETVILTLQQPTNTPPIYVAGWPDKAAAVIVDCSFQPPATHLLCDGAFHFFFPPANAAVFYRLECSQDMIHWLPVCTNTASEIGIHFTDPETQNFPNLFYRVVPQAEAPLDFP
ncbi:MAG TPA: Ig-like domain-containing protein [Verrucomicrobiae bacterium]|nr:Ig-like domain-containing protein [Verrucomicrobiae bacterium]